MIPSDYVDDIESRGVSDKLREALLNEFIGFLSVEYRWEQERWENCQALARLFLERGGVSSTMWAALAGAWEAGRAEGLEQLVERLGDSLGSYMKMASDAELVQFGVFAQAKDALDEAAKVRHEVLSRERALGATIDILPAKMAKIPTAEP